MLRYYLKKKEAEEGGVDFEMGVCLFFLVTEIDIPFLNAFLTCTFMT